MQTFLSIALSLVLAWACCHYARRRGRNPTRWFILGALFGIFALITLFILPIYKLKSNQVSEEPTSPKAPELTALFPLHAEKLWYYLDEQKKQFGPMSFSALNKAWSDGEVRDLTFVWNEEMENWKHLKDVIQPQPS